MGDGTKRAPRGCLYVCGACGKTSPTRYGIDASGRNVAMSGWDSSCVTHAVLIRQSDIEERSPSGRVVKTRKGTTEVPALTLVAKGA